MAELDTSAWLARGDNQAEWRRLTDALEFDEGFALFIAVVADAESERQMGELLATRAHDLGRRVVSVSAFESDQHSPSRVLARLDPDERVLVIIETTRASERDVEALERCFAQLNQRRDLLVERIGGPTILVLRPDALRHLLDVAPDLYSVHRMQMQYVGFTQPLRQPHWLLPIHELAGLLGLDASFGPVDYTTMPSVVRTPPEPPKRMFGRDSALASLREWLRPGAAKLVVVRGPLGVGKTVLVATVVAEQGHLWDRVLWADVRVAPSEIFLMRSLVLALSDSNEVPAASEEDLREQLWELLDAQAVLLVLDDAHFEIGWQSENSCIVVTSEVQEASGNTSINVAPLPDADAEALWAHRGCLTLAQRHRHADEWVVDPPPAEMQLLHAIDYPGREHRIMDREAQIARVVETLALLSEHTAAVATLRFELGVGTEPTPARTPRERIAHTLRACIRGQPEHSISWPCDTVDGDDVVLRHFVAVARVWRRFMLGALDGCDEILVDIRRTSRMWGSPFAYLRAWLLEFECARLRGDLEEAAALSHVVQWKAEIMGVTHPASLELALAASKTNQLCAREQDAREFAGELWLTLRRLEHPPFEPLRALAELYDAWGELSRVRAIATLLRKTYPEHEASLLRWLRGVIVRYHESERDGIDARLAELDESS